MSYYKNYSLYIIFDKTVDNDIKKYYKNYNHDHIKDAGIDLKCTYDIDITNKEMIDLHIICILVYNDTDECIPFDLRPRSSMALKTDLIMQNSPGTIDSGYRNTLKAVLTNINPCITHHIKKHDRYVQLVPQIAGKIKILCFDDINDLPSNKIYTSRNQNGFGSSGLN